MKSLPLSLMVHVQNKGDKQFNDNEWAGVAFKSDMPLRIEGFSLTTKHRIDNLKIEYMGHIQDIGDTNWKNEGDFIGTRSDSMRLEGFAIRLKGTDAKKYSIIYKAIVEGIGETDEFRDGEFCGTRGQEKTIYAIQIRLESVLTNLNPIEESKKQYLIILDIKGSKKLSKEFGVNLIEEIIRSLREQFLDIDRSAEHHPYGGDSLAIFCGESTAMVFLNKLAEKNFIGKFKFPFDINNLNVFVDKGSYNILGYDTQLEKISDPLLKYYQYIICESCIEDFGNQEMSRIFPHWTNFKSKKLSWGSGDHIEKQCRVFEKFISKREKATSGLLALLSLIIIGFMVNNVVWPFLSRNYLSVETPTNTEYYEQERKITPEQVDIVISKLNHKAISNIYLIHFDDETGEAGKYYSQISDMLQKTNWKGKIIPIGAKLKMLSNETNTEDSSKYRGLILLYKQDGEIPNTVKELASAFKSAAIYYRIMTFDKNPDIENLLSGDVFIYVGKNSPPY